jgi:hypothetical protein
MLDENGGFAAVAVTDGGGAANAAGSIAGTHEMVRTPAIAIRCQIFLAK